MIFLVLLCYIVSACSTYATTEPREKTIIVERRQLVEAVERREHRLGGGRVHKVEIEQIVYAHRFELKQRVRKICSLNLRHGRRQHFVAENVCLRAKISHISTNRKARSVYKR